MRNIDLKLAFTIICFTTATLLSASGEVTTLFIWRCGENDPGAGDGVSSTSTVDESGTQELSLTSTGIAPAYSSGNTAPGSVLSLQLDGDDAFSAASPVDLTDNFGMEIWAYPTSLDTFNFPMANGRTGNGGYGIVQTDGNWKIIHSGVVLGGAGPDVELNKWQHLALVRDSGVSTLYVNGIATGGTIEIAPSVPDTFMIGANLVGAGFEGQFRGVLDHARMFSFDVGAFEVADLSYPSVEGGVDPSFTSIVFDDESEPGNILVTLTFTSQVGTQYAVFHSTGLDLPIGARTELDDSIDGEEGTTTYLVDFNVAFLPTDAPTGFFVVRESLP